jgi:thymidine phosphorylase
MIEEGEMLAIIHANDEDKLNNAKKELFDCFEICDEFVEKPKVILEIIK